MVQDSAASSNLLYLISFGVLSNSVGSPHPVPIRSFQQSWKEGEEGGRDGAEPIQSTKWNTEDDNKVEHRR